MCSCSSMKFEKILSIFPFFSLLITILPLVDSQKDLVQPDETHLEGVPFFIQHPKPLYYTMKGHPATIECVAEPVSHVVIQCAEQIIPYKGPEESGDLKVTRLDSANRPDPNGKRWHLELQVRAREVEEWFDSYVCRCEAWNKVVKLKRPKKVVSKDAVIVEAYLDRKFQLEPVSTDLTIGSRIVLTCMPPKGKPEPETYWLRNGKRVTKKTFPHIILNDYNHLIIENVSPSDEGNYTCVAECLGVEFRYANARVRVTAPIANPQNPRLLTETNRWNAWSDCELTKLQTTSQSPTCQQKRIRTCAHPLIYFVDSPELHNTNQQAMLDCPHPWVQIRQCHTTDCSGSTQNGGSSNGQVMHLAYPPRNIGLIVLVAIFSILALLMCILAFIIYRTRVKRCKVEGVSLYSCCIGSGPNCTGDKNGRLKKDPLLLQDFKQSTTTIRHPTVLESVPLTNNEIPIDVRLVNGARRAETMNGFLNHKSVTAFNNPDVSSSGYEMMQTARSVLPTMTSTPIQIQSNGFHMVYPQPNISSPVQDGRLLVAGNAANFISQDGLLVRNGEIQRDSSTGPSSANTTTNTTAIGSTGIAGSSSGSLGLMPPNNNNMPATTLTDMTVKSNGESQSNQSSSLLYQYMSSSPPVYGCSSVEQPLNNDHAYNLVINENGGLLRIRDTGIQLHISPGTVRSGMEEVVSLTICHDTAQQPVLDETHTLLSPIVQLGSFHLTLDKHFTLTIPHCASLEDDSWYLRLIGLCPTESNNGHMEMFHKNHPAPSEDQTTLYATAAASSIGLLVADEKMECSLWQELVGGQISHIECNQDIICHIDDTCVRLLTKLPWRFCLIGTTMKQSLPTQNVNGISSPLDYQQARKRLRFMAFAGRPTPTMQYNIRVYVSPDTPASFDPVFNVEGRVDGRLLASSRPFIFQDNGIGLCFSMEDVSPGWRSRLQTNIQEIPFQHIWGGTQLSTLHCAFTLDHVQEEQLSLSCRIVVYQKSNWDGRENLKIFSSAFEESEHGIAFDQRLETFSVVNWLPAATLKHLCFKLNRHLPWLELARHMGYLNLVPQLMKQQNPIECLLELWQSVHPGASSIDELKKLLLHTDLHEYAGLLTVDI